MAKSLHFVSVALLFTACAFVSMPVTGYESGTHEFHRFDRMKAIEQLLLAFYPALGEHIGQLTFEVEELNLRPGGERETPIYVNFADCHVGSGVPAGGQPRFRYCPVPAGSPPLTDYLLSARVDTDTSVAFQVYEYWAHGPLVTARLDRFRTDVEKSPEWSDQQIASALDQANPSYGSTNREGLKQHAPSALVYKFSGCSLNFDKARLVTHRTVHPPDPKFLDIYWEVPGIFQRKILIDKKTMTETESCFAQFEPFEGNVISIYAK